MEPLGDSRSDGAHASVRAPLVLRTKLLAPRPAPAVLSRPRLVDALRLGLEQPVTLVTAPAGSGKTTLVAEFVRSCGMPFVWYQLDATDADPGLFLAYVASGLKREFPGFGEATLAFLRESPGEAAERPERAADLLIGEALDEIERRFVVVLDDYHHLGAETAVHRVVERLVAYLPDLLHLVVVSRDAPPLAVARLRARSALAVVGRDELLFTEDETRSLFADVFGLAIGNDEIAEYRERTQGWITALQLIREVAERRGGATNDLGEILRQSEANIFDYFAEEVFEGETEEVRALLLRASLLNRLEPDRVEMLFPGARAAALLPALVRRNVFVTVAHDERAGEFRIHPLFRDFLDRRLRADLGLEAYAAERRRLAQFHLERQEWEEAVAHLVAAGELDAVAATLAREGSAWVAEGRLATVESAARGAGDGACEEHPRALVWLAEAERVRGRGHAAETTLRRAADLLESRGDAEGRAEALHALAAIARRTGRYAHALALLDEVEAVSPPGSALRVKCGNTRGLCLVFTGRLAESELEFRTALDAAEHLGDANTARLIAHNLGLPAMMRGDFLDAMRWLGRMLDAGRDSAPHPHEATAHLNIARCHLFRGELGEAERHLEGALERAQQFNMEGLYGEIFEAYGNLERERREWARAADAYRRATRAYAAAGAAVFRHELLEERAILDLERGDLEAARSGIERLLAEREAAGDAAGVLAASLARARILLAAGELEGLDEQIEAARAFFAGHGFYYYEASACVLLAAWARETSGGGARMNEHLKRAVDLALRFDYEHWLAEQMRRFPRLFDSPEAASLLPADLREGALVAKAAVEPPVAEPVVEAPAGDLTIRMLGPVEIVRDPARPLAADAWTTRRARDILCYVASRRTKRASKDAIVDAFWPDADFETVEKNFHPTISHIRKALNSNQVLKLKIVVFREGHYLLNPELHYSLDTDQFDAAIADADAADDVPARRRALEQAVALYRGDFMEGVYDDWVAEPRAHYETRYIAALETLAHLAYTERDWNGALERAKAILARDPFREEIHCLAMRIHAAAGNRRAVKEQYESLRTLLDDELGVEPSETVERLYAELLL